MISDWYRITFSDENENMHFSFLNSPIVTVNLQNRWHCGYSSSWSELQPSGHYPSVAATFDHCWIFSPPVERRMIWLSLECASLRMALRKWNGSGEMREVNEMYLRLNTLRDRFGIGPLIKNHSEGEVMRRDRVRSEDSFGTLPYSREPSESIYHLL